MPGYTTLKQLTVDVDALCLLKKEGLRWPIESVKRETEAEVSTILERGPGYLLANWEF
jgi:hypothetical protein